MTAEPLQILADENIALVHEAFADLGELRTLAGRAITPALLRDVDILLVRSVTRVDASLLQNSRCRFVGTATSGTDHVDLQWLQQQGIAFADAHGCNAEAVVDYVLAALAWLALRDRFDWTRCSVGIVGCGAVGSRLARRLLALGITPRIHDPLLPATHALAEYFTSLEVVLAQQVVSLHTSLTHSGPCPTWHLLNAERLALLRDDAILLNAARGAVLDSEALLLRMNAAPQLRVVLDAWEGEPAVRHDLLTRVDLGTPHIAGYSRLGKLRGTVLLRAALLRHLGRPAQDFHHEIESPSLPAVSGSRLLPWQVLAKGVLAAYDPGKDHQAMQQLLRLSPGDAAVAFDRLRKQYPERAEFGQFGVEAWNGTPVLQQHLMALGFGQS